MKQKPEQKKGNLGITLTKVFLVAGILIVAVYDVIALWVWGVDATISRVAGVEASFDAPTIPFGVGFVCGHLFWPQKRSYRSSPEARAKEKAKPQPLPEAKTAPED